MIIILTTKNLESLNPVVKQLELLGYKIEKTEPRLGLITLDTNPENIKDLKQIEGVRHIENTKVVISQFKAKIRKNTPRDNRYLSWKAGYKDNRGRS